MTEIIQPLTEREAVPDGAVKIVDGMAVEQGGFIKILSTIQVMVAHASVASSEPKVELDSHADICVVGDNSLDINDHNRQVNVYNNKQKMATE